MGESIRSIPRVVKSRVGPAVEPEGSIGATSCPSAAKNSRLSGMFDEPLMVKLAFYAGQPCHQNHSRDFCCVAARLGWPTRGWLAVHEMGLAGQPGEKPLCERGNGLVAAPS